MPGIGKIREAMPANNSTEQMILMQDESNIQHLGCIYATDL